MKQRELNHQRREFNNLNVICFILILLFAFTGIYYNTYVNSKTINLVAGITLISLNGFRAISHVITFSLTFVFLCMIGLIGNWVINNSINWEAWFSDIVAISGGILLLITGSYSLRKIGLIYGFKCLNAIVFVFSIVNTLYAVQSVLLGMPRDMINITGNSEIVISFSVVSYLLHLPLYYFLSKQLNKRTKIISALNMIMYAIVVFSTGWRAAQFGLVLICTLTFVKILWSSKNITQMILKMAIIISITAVTYTFTSRAFAKLNLTKFGLYDTITSHAQVKDITSGRLSLFVGGIYIFRDVNIFQKLVGIGSGQFALYFQKYTPYVDLEVMGILIESEKYDDKGYASRLHPHNLTIYLLIEYGVCGLLLFSVYTYKIIERIKYYDNKICAIIIIFSLLLVSQLTGIGYYTNTTLWIILIFVSNLNQNVNSNL